MITILATIFVLGILVFVHELGHFIAAKRVGIRVEQFSLGFPPKMVGWKRGETEYRISWLPVGGYVKMAGQDDFTPEEGSGKPYEFYSKPIWQRIIVIGAGPVTNWAFSLVLFWLIILVSGLAVIKTTQVGKVSKPDVISGRSLAAGDRIVAVNGKEVTTWEGIYENLKADETPVLQELVVEKGGGAEQVVLQIPVQRDSFLTHVHPYIAPRVGTVMEGHPAEKAGMCAGDRVVAINGDTVRLWSEVVEIIHQHPGDSLVISWERAGESFTAPIVPDSREIMDENKEIITIGMIGIKRPVVMEKAGFFKSIKLGFNLTCRWTVRIFSFIVDLVTGRTSVRHIGGPIAIARMAGENARDSFGSLVGFMAILGINLAIINILPIPMFDGGHLLVFMVEGITRKKLTFKQRAVIQYIGLAIIITLTVFVLFNDIVNLARNI